jgi:hypothetical protein
MIKGGGVLRRCAYCVFLSIIEMIAASLRRPGGAMVNTRYDFVIRHSRARGDSMVMVNVELANDANDSDTVQG